MTSNLKPLDVTDSSWVLWRSPTSSTLRIRKLSHVLWHTFNKINTSCPWLLWWTRKQLLFVWYWLHICLPPTQIPRVGNHMENGSGNYEPKGSSTFTERELENFPTAVERPCFVIIKCITANELKMLSIIWPWNYLK